MTDQEQHEKREQLEFIDNGRKLKELRDSEGFDAFRELVDDILSTVFRTFLYDRDEKVIVAAAYQGRAVLGILRQLDERIEDAEFEGRKFARRAREAEELQRRDRSSLAAIRARRGSGVGA